MSELHKQFIALSYEISALLKEDKTHEAGIATKAFIEISKKLREEDKKQVREEDREAAKES